MSLQARGHGSWRCGQSQPDSRLGVNRVGQFQSPGGLETAGTLSPGPAGAVGAGNRDLESQALGEPRPGAGGGVWPHLTCSRPSRLARPRRSAEVTPRARAGWQGCVVWRGKLTLLPSKVAK